MERSKYEEIFVRESERYLTDLDSLLMQIEKAPGDQELWGEIHGKIHSIKGMARALSIDTITQLGHLMEEWCKQFQKGESKSADETIQAVFEGIRLLGHLVGRKGQIESFEDQQWYSSLVALFEKPPSQAAAAVKTVLPAEKKAEQMESIKEVRVRYSLIEELLGLAQEIQLIEKTLPPLPVEYIGSGLKNWISHYTSLMKTLYFRLAHLRLMSVADFAELFSKTIRNLAKDYGKTVRFEISGGEMQADITLLEKFREPLMHLLRNCLAHGIESPEEREAAGKEKEGVIRLEAGGAKENLLVTISDDGRGIDRTSIIEHLKQKRGLSDDDITAMTDEAILSTILSPEFSSTTETSDLAGRGIGMSVVAQAIDYLGGSLRIASKPGEGTRFDIRLPLSLSIVYSITFKVGDFILSIPTSRVASIDRMANLSSADIEQVYPIHNVLGVKSEKSSPFNVIDLKKTADEDDGADPVPTIKIPVDSILGNRPLMVMPVGELLAKAGLYAGVGIMENGDISLLLDIDKLPERFA